MVLIYKKGREKKKERKTKKEEEIVDSISILRYQCYDVASHDQVNLDMDHCCNN